MLDRGSHAPDFTLPDQADEPVRLAAELARGPVVLFFYPADFTPICTRQACMMRNVHAELAGAGYRVLGISGQKSQTHAKFAERHDLPYRLLYDAGRRVARQYGATSLGGWMPQRVSYLIDRDGRVADAVRADWSVGPHRAFVDRLLRAPVAG